MNAAELPAERLAYYRTGLIAGFLFGAAAVGLLVLLALAGRP